MVQSTVPPVVWLALIWSTWQIAFRALSKQEAPDRRDIARDSFTYIMGWGTLVGLILFFQVSDMIKVFLISAASAFCAIVLIWAYWGERLSKSKVPLSLQGIRLLSSVSFAIACVTEILSLDLLYDAGYLWGAHDELVWLYEKLGWQVDVDQVLNATLPTFLPNAHTAAPLSLFGIALSTVIIALFAYRLGLNRGRKRAK